MNNSEATPANVQPSAAPTPEEVMAWKTLSSDEKAQRWYQALVDGMNSPESSKTIEQIKTEVDQEFVATV